MDGQEFWIWNVHEGETLPPPTRTFFEKSPRKIFKRWFPPPVVVLIFDGDEIQSQDWTTIPLPYFTITISHVIAILFLSLSLSL